MNKKIIDDLMFVAEAPKLFLANYFDSLRAEVDAYYQDQTGLNHNKYEYKDVIDQIYTYEQSLYRIKHDMSANIKAIGQINNETEYRQVKENLLAKIFQNKTMIFKKKVLIIIEDAHIQTDTDIRSDILDSSLIKNIIFLKKIKYLRPNLANIIRDQIMSTESFTWNGQPFGQPDLKEIKDDAFEGFSNLKILILNVNELKHLNAIMFNPFLNLNELYLLNVNNLKLNKKIFESLVNLRKLEISCKISTNCEPISIEINENFFDCLLSLEDLSLTSAHIQEINHSMFKKNTNLSILSLCSNNISNIKEGSFSSLSKLFLLDIRHNKLKELCDKTFIGLANLNHLYLNGNKLKKLNKKVFSPLVNIKCIELDDNLIEDVKDVAGVKFIANYKL